MIASMDWTVLLQIQEQSLAQHEERFESGPDTVPGEFEIPNIHFAAEQTGAKGAGIRDKILLKPGFAGADIGQQTPFLVRHGDDGPLIENGPLVPGHPFAGHKLLSALLPDQLS